jgi:ABC-type Fe3+-hydroxamate transport system substrate-binding protein
MTKPLLAILVVLLNGCASITGDQTQPITIFAVCAGSAAPVAAECILENDKSRKIIVSPGTVAVKRSFSDLTVQCVFENSKTGRVILSSKSDEKILGNIVAGGVIGAAVDVGTGAAFNYPNRATVLMDCAKK